MTTVIVIEAVVENPKVKHASIKEVEGLVKDNLYLSHLTLDHLYHPTSFGTRTPRKLRRYAASQPSPSYATGLK